MNPRELVFAAMRGDALSVRQVVKDAARAAFAWSSAPAPDFNGPRACAVYASLVELLADRNGEMPPLWTANVKTAPHPVFLVRSAKRSNALRRMSLSETPEMLRKRNVFAVANYLDMGAQ